MTTDIYEKLKELNITLPPCPTPVANYITGIMENGIIFVAGQTGWQEDKTLLHPGKVGKDVTTEQAYVSARLAAIRLISELAGVADLNRIRIMKVNGYVNAIPEFVDHPIVMNGVSDLLVSVFGARGTHARTAIGVASLPDNACVEVELVAVLMEDSPR